MKVRLANGAARLDLYDLGGRRVHRRMLEESSAGWSTVRIELPRTLGPGVYFLRLEDRHGSRSQRVLVLP